MLLSDEYEKDEKCRDIFLHAKSILKKPVVIIVVGKKMNWQKTQLGYEIGPSEVYMKYHI